MNVKCQFEEWVKHLHALKLPVANMLLPGLDEQYIRRMIGEIGLNCPEELVEFYGYCGGVGAPQDALLNHMWMYGSHFVLPFDQAVANYKLFNSDIRWNKSWFPILGNDGGDFYSIGARQDLDNWEMITYFMLGSGTGPETRYSSLLNMLTVFNECFDRGICFVDEHGDLATKFLDASLVAMNHNSGLPYYQ